jgi:hypothetical protein
LSQADKSPIAQIQVQSCDKCKMYSEYCMTVEHQHYKGRKRQLEDPSIADSVIDYEVDTASPIRVQAQGYGCLLTHSGERLRGGHPQVHGPHHPQLGQPYHVPESGCPRTTG